MGIRAFKATQYWHVVHDRNGNGIIVMLGKQTCQEEPGKKEIKYRSRRLTLKLARFPSVGGSVPSMELLFRKIFLAVTMFPNDAGIAPAQA